LEVTVEQSTIYEDEKVESEKQELDDDAVVIAE